MLKKIKIQDLYDYEENNILNEFYIPALRNATNYRRITGNFSSTSLATVAKGFSRFFFNNGIMRILSSIVVSEDDYKVFSGKKDIPQELEDKIMDSIEELENFMVSNHLSVLAWLLKENRLKIRFILMKNSNRFIFHEKVGILMDESDNSLVFFGSLNESTGGWDGNGERFKVLRSWGENLEKKWLKDEIQNFEKKWKLGVRQKSVTFNLTDAIINKILKFSEKNSREKCEKFIKEIYETDLEKEIEAKSKQQANDSYELRKYQDTTLEDWINNNYMGIIPFETAGGKTITAVFGLMYLYKSIIYNKGKNLLISLVVPSNVIAEQWKETLKKFFEKNVTDQGLKESIRILDTMSSPDWSKILQRHLSSLTIGDNYLIIVIFSYNGFIKRRSRRSQQRNYERVSINLGDKTDSLLIADEVHHIGAETFRQSMSPNFKYRLGLSATYERQFDQNSSKEIVNYFGGVLKGITYQDLLNHDPPFVAPYNLYYIKVELNNDEKSDYLEKSKMIAIIHEKLKKSNLSKLEKKDLENKCRSLLIKRADILKTSYSKLSAIRTILEIVNNDRENRTLLFASNSYTNNLYDQIKEIVMEYKRIKAIEIIDSTDQNKRKMFLNGIKKNNINLILAKRVLDEGLSVENVTTAIFCSIDSTKRQWIQRRGRIIRYDPNYPKKIASLYDIYMTINGKIINSESKRLNFLKNDAIEVKDIGRN